MNPLAYLPPLAEALYEYSRQDFSDRPRIALALRAEAVAAARRMCALEPERTDLLTTALARYRDQLTLMGQDTGTATTERDLLRSATDHPRPVPPPYGTSA
ncbi:hypothetical protein ACFWUW_14080 [Streptomyces sp. NPDC058655]|uniref:hypothetical protein n=1 Tax=Streptomyces sp. NPDC058655 TaxID=3346577 RepID=UPI003660B5CC